MLSTYTVSQLLQEIMDELPGVDMPDFLRVCNQETGKLGIEYPWRHLQDVYRFDTTEQYITGTVSVTNGDATVTGSGTTFTSGMVDRKFKIDTDSGIYVVETFTDTTHIVLDRPYAGDTDSALEYRIFQDTYSVPTDFWRLLQITDCITGYKLREKGPMKKFTYNLDTEFPREYMQWGSDADGNLELIIDGIPATSRQLDMIYWRKPNGVDDPGNTPDLPAHLHEALKLSVLLVYMRRGDKREDAFQRRQEIKMDLGNALRLAKKQDAEYTRPEFRNERVLF